MDDLTVQLGGDVGSRKPSQSGRVPGSANPKPGGRPCSVVALAPPFVVWAKARTPEEAVDGRVAASPERTPMRNRSRSPRAGTQCSSSVKAMDRSKEDGRRVFGFIRNGGLLAAGVAGVTDPRAVDVVEAEIKRNGTEKHLDCATYARTTAMKCLKNYRE